MSKTIQVLSKAHEQRQGHGLRKHLGASLIGRDCARHLWYVFRWAKKAWFPARILRLFDRGTNEEEIIAARLRKAGIHVLTRNPQTNEQFRIEDHHGHFGGSLDAVIFDSPDFPGMWVLGEFKTHNDKSFNEVKKQGLAKAKPEHYGQMQIYMKYTSLPAGLYFYVNKNDDDMDAIPVHYDAGIANQLSERAYRIILSPTPPPRISESPGFYKCRMCDHQNICHHDAKKDHNCRTCVFSRPIENAQWFCDRYKVLLSEQDQRRGCQTHQEIPE